VGAGTRAGAASGAAPAGAGAGAGAAAAGGAAAGRAGAAGGGATQWPASQMRSPLQSVSFVHWALADTETTSAAAQHNDAMRRAFTMSGR
jgi:hypothetical protein